ncbi:MAG TPA: aminopeptidase [Candidatus Atribacteria bacterium]|nr:aminopeptidase [Candidatus Atribacteria bacterium]
MNNEALKRYARLIVKTGLNLQKNQTLVIASPIECADFTRLTVQTAYDEGAREVVVRWTDELTSKITYKSAPDEIFDEFPDWQKQFYEFYDAHNAAYLSISASDPELFKDVDPGRLSRANKAARTALKVHSERLMGNKIRWCIASVPTKAWAKKVFPDAPEQEAVDMLWDAILKAVRADSSDPVAEWARHTDSLKAHMEKLNKHQFDALHIKNSLGTDLVIKLPKGHIWLGGSELSADGVEFIANMPTEEIFTAPRRDGVDGTVVASMPLNYNGNLIEDFSITFEKGRIVDFSAKKGYEVLKQLIETDEGAHYLGELALVPYDSPISNMNILFYNTLFDENASCHLAIGKAYPICLEGSDGMTPEELEAAGINNSLVHVDFMFGTADLEITGVKDSGEQVPVFRKGNFVI